MDGLAEGQRGDNGEREQGTAGAGVVVVGVGGSSRAGRVIVGDLRFGRTRVGQFDEQQQQQRWAKWANGRMEGDDADDGR